MTQTDKKILIVEDEAAVRTLINRILSHAGYDVSTANDGVEGLEAVGREKFDLIISDIVMPRMKGTQMVRELRKQDAETAVIFVTGYSQEDSFELGEKEHLLLKPFNQQQLNDLVSSALQTDGA